MEMMQNLWSEKEWKSVDSLYHLITLCKRGGVDFSKIMPIVEGIEQNVLEKGDAELHTLLLKFEGVTRLSLLVSEEEFAEAESLLSDDLKNAIRLAYKNIFSFHYRQKRSVLDRKETAKGIICWQEFRAIEKVGLYIPGGTAPLFSTVLMLAIPAKIAECSEIILCTPPQKNGKIAPEVLWTAALCGVKTIFTSGGSQAIFAMAHGTESIPKVDKIFGPGNGFVTAAKMKVSSHTAIDMPAGPSEVLVIADENANAVFCAADLLSQAEHGADSQSVLVCTSQKKAEEILIETQKQLERLPRKEVAIESLKHSFAIIVKDLEEAIFVSNTYAPEHLILQTEEWESLLSKIQHAGSVFCGKYSCESAGDYASGTNHTLPTSAFARNFSGVSVESFGKWITFQHLSKEGIESIGKAVELMAEAEGLDAHKNAMTVRIEYKNSL